jgi:hypothetical protein
VYESPIIEYSCHRVGVRVTSHSYWKHGVEVQSTLGRVRSQLSWENRGNLYGENRQFFTFSFEHEQQGESRKKRALELEQEGWVNLEHVGAFLEHFGAGN